MIRTGPQQARAWSRDWRAQGRTLGFVPTMGALHEGHLELVRRAKRENGAVCVSVFVNPLQFDDPKDLSAYPRDLDGDARLLAGVGNDLLFTGELADFFPDFGAALAQRGLEAIPREDPGPDAAGLEGAFRPGHFAGVATICRRLFEWVSPRRAYFGEKDFQQTLVVRHLARRLGFPEIVVCPTEREASGLARSSRNQRLSPAEREHAALLYRALLAARSAWERGERRRAALEAELQGALSGERIDYAVVRDPERFASEPERLERAQALLAVRIGPVRLIDNLRLDGPLPTTGPKP
jgi:pantoate--beta-alanine ligase